MKKIDRHLTDSIYEQLARIGKAVSSPKRLEILDLLSQAPRTVDALAKLAHTSHASMSQHLQTLRGSNLVTTQREGTAIRYQLADDTVAEFFRALRVLAVTHLPELDRITNEYFSGQDAIEPIDRKTLLKRVRHGELTIIDVRPVEEYLHGHIQGAISIPIDELEDRLAEVPLNQEIVAYCQGPYCVWSGQAVEFLRKNNFNAMHLKDGVSDWRAHGFRISTGEH